MKKIASLFLVACLLSYSMAEDSTQKKNDDTSPLFVYSWGIGAGALRSVNPELKDISAQFLKLSFLNRIYFNQYIDLFLDADWFAPGDNYGADFGGNFYFTSTRFRPFVGIGAGCHYFSHENGSFGTNIGPSATIHAGFLLDVTETFQVEFQAPYHITLNKPIDHGAGFQVGFIFSQQFKNVRKLKL